MQWYIVEVSFANSTDTFVTVARGSTAKQAMWSASLKHGHEWSGEITALTISSAFETEAQATEQLRLERHMDLDPALDTGFNLANVQTAIRNSG